MRELNISYEIWKNVIDSNSSWDTYHLFDGYNSCRIWTGTSEYVYYSEITADAYDDWKENYISNSTQVLKSDDAIAHILSLGSPISYMLLNSPSTSANKPIVAIEKPDASRATFFSHNWCDPTTWFGDSVYVINEDAYNSGDNKTYYLDHVNVIDMFHGKIFMEDYLVDSDGYDFRIYVSVNSIDGYVEHDPHYTDYSDSYDFVVDYENGSIVFAYELQPSDNVSVTYHYENGSTFYVNITEGKSLLIDSSEVQFSDDVNLTDSIKYQVFVTNPYYPVYGPQKVAYGIANVYKTMSDFQVEAVKTYPVFPTVGESGNWRAMQKPLIVLNWDYVSGTALKSSYGTEVRVWLEHHEPIEGTYASLTFYGSEEDE